MIPGFQSIFFSLEKRSFVIFFSQCFNINYQTFYRIFTFESFLRFKKPVNIQTFQLLFLIPFLMLGIKYLSIIKKNEKVLLKRFIALSTQSASDSRYEKWRCSKFANISPHLPTILSFILNKNRYATHTYLGYMRKLHFL